MGYRIAASCDCGYETEFRVGGTMSNQVSVKNFPYYCEHCGLVVVNIFGNKKRLSIQDKVLGFLDIKKKETTEEPLCCPKCSSQDIKQYGKEPMLGSKRSSFEIIYSDVYLDGSYNFCPSCKQYTMRCDIDAFVD